MLCNCRVLVSLLFSFSFPSSEAHSVVLVVSGLPPSTKPRCPPSRSESSSAPVSYLLHPSRRIRPTICILFASKQILNG
ncbi:hypothetical protein EDD22DRAFT_861840 [Suillus occidentalis]|nr:hypothetical protein EDD22DRAFT_861840 [Suillus occidentalis]